MGASEELFQQSLAKLTERYRQAGFSVELNVPLQPDLSADLIARRPGETVLVDAKVSSGKDPGLVRRLSEIAAAKGWKFVVAVFSPRDVDVVELKSNAEIAAKVSEARQLGRSSTAFPLLAWSIFEASARIALARANRHVASGTPPRGLVQQLAALGLLDISEERELTALAADRNRLAHGFWPSEPPTADRPNFDRVLDIAERLIGGAESNVETQLG